MKHPTDEEIEKFIRPLGMLPTPQTVAIVTEVIKWARDQQVIKLPDGITYEEQINRLAADSKSLYDAVELGFKLGRNQQPKLKTLEDWGWKIQKGHKEACTVKTPLGLYTLRMEFNGEVYWAFINTRRDEITPWTQCASFEDAKQLAQADYEKRINELYA